MNKLQKMKLELGILAAKFSKYSTNKGEVVIEGDWLTTSIPMFVVNEDNGELLDAPDGEYELPETKTTYTNISKQIITVVGGIITDVQTLNDSTETTEETETNVEAPSTEVTPETETTTETVEQTATEIEQAEDVIETPAKETTTTETPAEDVKPEDEFKKVYEMLDTMVKEIESLKTTVEALSTTMDNAKLGQQTIKIDESQLKKTADKKFVYSAEKLKIK